ncbi:MAG TPA: SAM-dependent methyltransferase [Actinophytocola sp.]|uniref:SAM-dependent methyltransferase n=1 Tax=Actinophytocola sp. TaxID=1872138 RepID=UPI002DBD9252|nr:SAM-dependent methyltransferase [Actinophytocola sp.]HEU5472168.1 SAM-dependent methyltransferase [Actinophytocola sp.]
MATEKLTNLSRTAIGVAFMRAVESRRPDRLFEDPLAEAFVVAAQAVLPDSDLIQSAAAAERTLAVFGPHIAVRTRFYDDYLLAATGSGCRQVVLLAAGLDTRAFRLAWPDGVRLFEVDLPEMTGYKEQVLAARQAEPGCARTVLDADLRADWPARLTEAGLRPAEPTAWLLEGLLAYLTADEVAALLTAVGSVSAPGSRLACEHLPESGGALLDLVQASGSTAGVAHLWKGGLSEELSDWLDRAGWRPTPHSGQALADAYGRPDPEAFSMGFLTAVRATS